MKRFIRKSKNNDEYLLGYREGYKAYETENPVNPDDLSKEKSQDYCKGYRQGFNDAFEENSRKLDEE